MSPTAALIAAWGLTVAGVVLLRTAWRARAGGWRMAAGWLALAAGVVAWRGTGVAWDKAVAFGLLAPLPPALVLVAASARLPGRWRRAGPEPRTAIEPASNADRLWRGVGRTLLAGPLALAAAAGLCSALAVKAPWQEADRFILALFLLPLAWAAGAIWATTDARLARVAAGLGGLALAGFGAAAL
ncbi:hypothetical protein [Phenylobacterium sp.]|uniref:hypothetical protein n=1 Tax=Phenylobacterium sp. TaxID=1871053 RepID=UPI0025DE7FF1|nr:hypothetical protein [Phenylobacterium sp.]